MEKIITPSDLAAFLDFQITQFSKKAASLGLAFNTDFVGTIASLPVGGTATDAAKLVTQFALYDKALQLQGDKFEAALGAETVQVMNQIAIVLKEFYTRTLPSLTEAEVDAFIGATKNLALTVATSNYKGIADDGWADALDAFKKTIIGGGSKDEAIDALKNVSVAYGVSPLPQNVASATTDALNQFARVYNMTIMASMGQEWFSYTGSTMETSRCFCLALEERGFFHISEIPLLLEGKTSAGHLICTQTDEDGVEHKHIVKIYDKTGLPQGMIVGTTQQSFFVYAGGWNCGHQIFPVSDAIVPGHIVAEVIASPVYKKYITEGKKTFSPPVAEKIIEALPPPEDAALAAKKKKQSEAGKKAAATKKRNLETARAKAAAEAGAPTPAAVADKTFAGEDIVEGWKQNGKTNRSNNTATKYKDSRGNWTPERAALHEVILDRFMQGLKPIKGQKKIVAVGGSPAAGKSTLTKTNPELVRFMEQGFANVETDAFKRALPEYTALLSEGITDAARYTHEESKYLVEEFVKRLTAKDISMVVDRIWNDGWQTVARDVKRFKDAGYEVSAKYIVKDTDNLLRDARARAKDTGFEVNEAVIEENGPAIQRDLVHLATQNVFKNLEVFDGNTRVKEGEQYPMIFRTTDYTDELMHSNGFLKDGNVTNLNFTSSGRIRVYGFDEIYGRGINSYAVWVEKNQWPQFQKWIKDSRIDFGSIQTNAGAEAEMWQVFALSHPDYKAEYIAALYDYTGSGYADFNRYLRKKKSKAQQEIERHFEENDKVTAAALQRLPKLKSNVVTYRTNKFQYGSPEFAQVKAVLDAGKIFEFPAYASTTMHKEFALGWWNHSDGIFLEIESCDNVPIDIMSSSGIREREALLHHSHKYEVIKNNGRIMGEEGSGLYSYRIKQIC